MSDVADAPQRRSPFADVPARDVVRDVVAAVALLVALPLPWDVGHRGSDLLWVVLTTVLALVALAAPYGQRAGVLTGAGSRLAEPSTRLFCLLPYAAVAVLYLVLDVARSAADAGYVGGGLAVGLAGVMLAAAVPGPRPAIVTAVVVALGAVATPVVTMVHGEPWQGVVGSVLSMLLVLGLLWLTVRRFLRGDEPAGIVLIAVGAAIAVEIAFLGGGQWAGWLESLHGGRYGMLLLPVVAAAAVPTALDRAAVSAGEPSEQSARRWVGVAVQAFELMTLVAGFVAAVAVLRITAGIGAGLVEAVLRLVVGVLVVILSVLARRSLVRDPRSGHSTAVGAACLVVVLGVVILVARAGVGTASRVEELLLALALPALVLAALSVPPSVKALLAAEPMMTGETPAADRVAYPSSAGERGDQTYPAQQAHQGHQGPSSQPTPQAADPTDQGSRWRGTWAAGTDATQQMSPVRVDDPSEESAPGAGRGADETAVQQPIRPAQQQPAEPQQVHQQPASTQILPPVADVPGSPWTAEQALDPNTPLESLAAIVTEAPHLRPHVAANPSTYPALLDWLGALGNPAVDAALRTRR